MGSYGIRPHERREDDEKYTLEYTAAQPTWRCRRQLAEKMLAMGFHKEFRLSFAVLMCGPFVLTQLPGLNNREEFLWLCNRIRKLYFKKTYKKRKSDRLSFDHHGKPGPSYLDVQTYAKGHATDVLMTNAKANTSYWLGYNEEGNDDAD